MLESIKKLYLKKDSNVMVEHYNNKTNFAFILLWKMRGKCWLVFLNLLILWNKSLNWVLEGIKLQY